MNKEARNELEEIVSNLSGFEFEAPFSLFTERPLTKKDIKEVLEKCVGKPTSELAESWVMQIAEGRVSGDRYLFVVGARLHKSPEEDGVKILVTFLTRVLATLAKLKEQEKKGHDEGIELYDQAIFNSDINDFLKKVKFDQIGGSMLGFLPDTSSLDDSKKDGEKIFRWFSDVVYKKCLQSKGSMPPVFADVLYYVDFSENKKLIAAVKKHEQVKKLMEEIKTKETSNEWLLFTKYFLTGFLECYLKTYKDYFYSK